MSDVLALNHVDERAHPEIGPLVNALATIVNSLLDTVDVLHERLDQLEDYLGLEVPPFVVDTPDIATYTPPEDQ